MSQATRPNDRHIIWSNQNLDVDDWREDYKEFLKANELDDNPNDEQALYEWMVETNGDYLYDERANLNIQLSQPIIVIGDIGRWNGRVMGYKDIPSGNIRDCLYADTDYTEWYVDKYGDLRADAAHHDGTNHYLYRVFKEGVSETQMENLRDKIYHGKATRADITRLTRRLGDEIAAVYGFDIPKQRTPQERGRKIMTDFTLRPLTVPERKYTYAQSSQLQGQTGNIGYLRGDFGSSGDQFYTTWFDTRPQWKSDEFKRDLDDVINALRSEEYGLLQSRSQMVRYGRESKESEMQGAYTTEFGFRADTEKYAFVLRCNPTRGDYNFYCLCYVKEWLDKHIEEANRDIRFIDSHYKELFRIPDGERIIVTDRDGKTESYPCRYIDSYHTEVGRNLFHICEFAERMEQGGCTYAPMEPPLPPMCYSILPSTGEVIQIDRWQKGYTATRFNDGNRVENEAIKDKFNEKLGVTKAQEQAMLAGSMIRWDSIAAKPKSYDENGKAIKPKDYER